MTSSSEYNFPAKNFSLIFNALRPTWLLLCRTWPRPTLWPHTLRSTCHTLCCTKPSPPPNPHIALLPEHNFPQLFVHLLILILQMSVQTSPQKGHLRTFSPTICGPPTHHILTHGDHEVFLHSCLSSFISGRFGALSFRFAVLPSAPRVLSGPHSMCSVTVCEINEPAAMLGCFWEQKKLSL